MLAPEKLDSVRSDEVIDYTKGDFTDKIRDLDRVLETVGGEHAERSLKVLRDGGVSLFNVSETTRTQAKARGIHVERMSVVPDRQGLVELGKLVDARKLAVHVAKKLSA